MSAFSSKACWTLNTDDNTLVYGVTGSDPSYKFYNNISWSLWGMWQPCNNKNALSMWEDTASANRSWLLSMQEDQTFRFIGSWDGLNFCLIKTTNLFLDFSWHHFVVTFQNGTVQIYVDGVLQSLNTVLPWSGGDTLNASNIPVVIANNNPTSGFVENASPGGGFSNFSIWNKVLTQSDVTALYNNGQPANLVNHPSYANLTNWWRLDQTDTLPTLTDSRAPGASATVHTSGSSAYFAHNSNVPLYYTDPGVSNVLANATYIFQGNTETGTLQQVFNTIGAGILSRLQIPAPSAPQITFTQGDEANLLFYVQDQNGNPVNLTGATFSTQIVGANGVGPVTFPNSQHTIVNATLGQVQLALATTDTQACGEGSNKSVVMTITQSGAPLNFWGNGILTVLPPSPSF